MGNQVGVSREPPQLAELFPFREESLLNSPSHGEIYEHPNDGFRSYIQMWRFYSDSGDDMFIKNSPVKLGAFKKFDSRDCYIALHIFKNIGDAKHNPTNSHENPQQGTPYSLHELVLSSIEELTPRGIASSFGTLSLEPFIHTSREEYTHDLYVWNGKASTPLAKAVALAKGFEIERVLVKEKITSTVYHRFARGPKSSLSSIFKDDIEDGKPGGDSKRYDVNHLFRQLLSPYKRPSSIKIGELFGNHQGDPSRFEVLKKSLHHKFEPGTSSPTSSPRHDASPTRRPPKVPALSLSQLPSISQQQIMDDATPRPVKMPAFVKSATEGSITLPSHLLGRRTPSLSMENLRESPETEEGSDFSTWAPQRLLKLFEPRLSQILDFLFLSSRIPTEDKALLKSQGVTHILNCAGNHCTNHFPNDFTYKTYFISDSSSEDITCLFYETLDYIEEARLNGGKVVIHCHQGVSRSSSFIILYLMWQFRWDFLKAHDWVRSIRYISNPNPGFTGQLIMWYSNMQRLPIRPRPHPVSAPTQPPQPPISSSSFSSSKDNNSNSNSQRIIPLATPRNPISYEPIATPRGPRISDPTPTPRNSTPQSQQTQIQSPIQLQSPIQSPIQLPSQPQLQTLSQAPRSNSSPAPTQIQSLAISLQSHSSNSTPTPGEPPPNTRANLGPPSPPSIPTLIFHQPKSLIRTASDPTHSSSSPPPTPLPLKLYRLVSHSQNTIVVPKLIADAISYRSLDPRGCFALCTPGVVYLWYGSRCPSQLSEGARRAVEKLQRYENVSPFIEDLRQGCEHSLFWNYFDGGSGEVVENVQYREYLQLGAQSPGRREQVSPTPGERAKLYKLEDNNNNNNTSSSINNSNNNSNSNNNNNTTWDKYEIYDDSDLEEDGIFVLYAQQPRHVWVWIGCEYSGKWGVNGEAVDGLLVARQFRNDYALPDEGDITIIKDVAQETEEFLSHFH